MSVNAIEVLDVSKKFHRGELHDSLRDLVPAMTKRLWGRRPRRDELGAGDFWALRDVTFVVERGRALGIIGPNGAGKSTMLKLLTRILRPTRGRCDVCGRIGALIEIAAGFHPDLTGRENIYLQGVIMGMRRADITRRLEEIVEFAGVGPFIDTPVKRYSSGMHARLGFSVAAHLDPEVLLIDEVLSVGDIAFQAKCIERMKQFKRQGVAIVFVSHNLQAVADLCDRAVYLNSEVRAQGPTHGVLEQYVRASEQHRGSARGQTLSIIGARLLGRDGNGLVVIRPGTPLTLQVTYEAHEDIEDLHLGFLLHRSTDGLRVYDGNIPDRELGFRKLVAGQRLVVDFSFRPHVTRGQYHIEVHAYHNPTQAHLARLSPAAIFAVEETRTYTGVADVELECALSVHSGTDPVAAEGNLLRN